MKTQTIEEFSAHIGTLSGPKLVELYNEMLDTWQMMGGDNRYGTVKRFATPEKGRERLYKFHQAILALRAEKGLTDETPAAAEATTAQGNTAPAGTTTAAEEQTPASESEDEMAKRRKKVAAGKKRGTARQTNGTTIRELTEEFNSLVPKALKAGLKVKHHSSMFESKDAAKKQLTKLKKALA